MDLTPFISFMTDWGAPVLLGLAGAAYFLRDGWRRYTQAATHDDAESQDVDRMRLFGIIEVAGGVAILGFVVVTVLQGLLARPH